MNKTTFLLLVIVFGLVVIVLNNPSSLLDQDAPGSRPTFRAVSDTTALSVSVICHDNNTVQPSGKIEFFRACAFRLITEIDDLIPGWMINVTVYGSDFPFSYWTVPEPSLAEVGPHRIVYFDLTIVNDTVPDGPYPVYFNLTDDLRGDVSPQDVRLFIYDSGWRELDTVVLVDGLDPTRYVAVTPHLSEFVIADKSGYVPPVPPAPSVGGGKAAPCVEVWNCTPWSICYPDGHQSRFCRGIVCNSGSQKESRSCVYSPSCSDRIFNGDESDFDCGGSCLPCVDGKRCNSDSDCVNQCDPDSKRCFSQIIVPVHRLRPLALVDLDFVWVKYFLAMLLIIILSWGIYDHYHKG